MEERAIAWTFRPEKRSQPFFASAAATDAIVVVGSRDRRVRGLDRTKGTEVWTFLTEGNVDSSPVVVGGRVFAGSLDGKLYVLDLAKGSEITRFELDGGDDGIAGGGAETGC